ncbi:MAG: amino acid adenylation domain-containing protein [Pseudomonadota bacterium]
MRTDAQRIDNIYPLVPMQEGLLFHSLLSPRGGGYLPQVVLTLEGPLDAERLKAAWQATMDRHPALRTSFHWKQRDRPFQVVHRELTLPWVVQDWQSLDEGTQQARLRALLDAQRAQPFDLERAPLMRLVLAQLAAQRHLLVWSHHHLLLDGWSASLVLREVFMRAAELPPPPAPRPYADFVAWHQARSKAQADAPHRSLDWWRQRLAHTPPQALIPGLRQQASRGNALQPRPEHRSLVLGPDLSRAIRALAASHGLTLSTLMQAALGLLLRRHGLGDDIVFGTTLAGRPPELPGSLDMVGLFIQTVPVRLRIAAHRPLIEWLHQVQSDAAQAAEHAHVSLRELQAALQGPDAPAGGRALFDCLLVIESYPTGGNLVEPGTSAPTSSGQPLRLAAVDVDESTHFGLTLQVSDGGDIRLTARFDAHRVQPMDDAPEATHPMQSLLAQMGELLAAMARGSQRRIGELLAAGGITSASQDAPRSEGAQQDQPPALMDSIEAVRTRLPQALALVVPAHTDAQGRPQPRIEWDIATLHRHADTLARQLQQLGAAPERTVALHLPRGAQLLTAVLATLKTGAAFLPLDTDQPSARLARMLSDARPIALLTLGLPTDDALVNACQDTDTPILPATDWAQAPTSGEPTTAATPEAWPPPPPTQAAYLLYTSGSTGRPKGVVNHHAGIGNRIAWMQAWFKLQPGQRVLHKTPVGFDVSVWELLWPLACGATLVMAPPGMHRDPAALAQLLHDEAIDLLHFVPTMLADFLQHAGQVLDEGLPALRHIVCSGEVLSGPLMAKVHARLPSVQLHNLYGPTEAAIDVTAHTCGAQDATDQPVAIGRAIEGIAIHVLDPDGHPCPPGMTGRLHIGGIGLARGYLGLPGLSAERFIPAPAGMARPGLATLYDSGDLARTDHSGKLHYLGRADDQVKLRGVRIELGEIEAALLQQAGTAQAVCRLWPDDTGTSPRLCAYLVAEPGQPRAPDTTVLQALRQNLPDAMLPSHIVWLDTLPLGASGKPDRAALPRPVTQSTQHEPAATATEQALAAIWQDTLRLPALPGRQDSFFALGGHSLVAMRIVTRVQKQWQVALPLTDVFEHPTLQALATRIDALIAPPPPAAAPGWRELEF